MSELIGIREAARRIGVSDTAVRKAIEKNRVSIAGRSEAGWPLLMWPEVSHEWVRNSDVSKRSHVGSRGSPLRSGDAPQIRLPTSNRMDETPDLGGGGVSVPPPSSIPDGAARGPSYAQSRAIREAYAARLAKLEFEEKSGKLVNADDVKAGWFKHIKAAQTRVMGIPSACKTRMPELPLPIVAAIESICREALEDLANGGG